MTVPSTIADAAAQLRAGSLSAADLVEASLDAINLHNARTNAFIRVDANGARAAARTADLERKGEIDRGPLHGIPISIKDLIDIAGQPTTAASRVFQGRVAAEDAPVVARLRQAGAILIGKTNLHEFALGTTSEDSAWGPVRNPRDPSRSAGGSSGGSAAAVATGMGLASVGSDTGGSIRIPAAACGVVGLKPTLGEVPTAGVIPLGYSLDHVGPLSTTVEDAAALWCVLAGRHPERLHVPQVKTLRLQQLNGYFGALAPEVRTAFDSALERLRGQGVQITTRALARTALITDAYVNLVLPEAAHWHAQWLNSRAGDYTAPVRARLEEGRGISAVDYLKARETRGVLRNDVDAALEDCDALLLPTLPIVAPPLGASEVPVGPDGRLMTTRAAMLKHTQLFNLTGHPAISLPLQTSGLPVGLQLVGRRDQTPHLLGIAAACERILTPR